MVNDILRGIKSTTVISRNKISFLDSVVNRWNYGMFETSVYDKVNHTKQKVNDNSNKLTLYKKSCE